MIKILTNIIATVGFFIVIGSIGAGEMEKISFIQATVQMLIGLIMFVGGVNIGIYVRQR